MSKNKAEVDCTRRCRSRSHGQTLTSAITKRSVSDQALASFIRATCANFVKAFDFEGRTALHMAASRGRLGLMEWLVRHSPEAFANARDRESGYTPLHRSIFYGQINAAVALMKIGVSTDIVDKDDYKALEHAMLDRHYMFKLEDSGPSDVYVWGSNSNYTLGTGTQQQRNSPELLGSFSRNNTCVKQVCLGKFHSVWLCSGASGGEVWCCGQVSRAGGPRATCLAPATLTLPEGCVQCAIMLHATVFLLESGAVIQYSLNSSDNVSQSNVKTPSSIKLPPVKPLIKLSQPLGVCAGRSHAVAWNVRALYTWGANVGQLGHPQEEKVIAAPKRVAISINNKEEAGFQLAGASDAATVFTTSRGDVYLLHKYMCRKIAVKQINLRQVCVEAKVSEQGVYSRVTVLLLTTVGQLLIWQDTNNQLTRCVFGLSHQTVITQVTLTHDALYFTTKHGEAFIGTISRKATPTQPQPIRKEKERDNNKSALVKFLEKDDCTPVRITKIPNVHRAVSIAVDSEGLNFACLQKRVNLEQRRQLFAFMQGHEDLARGRVSGPDAARQKKLLLQQLAEELNSMGSGATKSPEKWLKCWQDWKSDVKSKFLKIKLARAGTGGGPSPAPLSPLEEDLLQFFGMEMVEGIPGVADPLQVATDGLPSSSIILEDPLGEVVEQVVEAVVEEVEPQDKPRQSKSDPLNKNLERQAAAVEDVAAAIREVAAALRLIAFALQPAQP